MIFFKDKIISSSKILSNRCWKVPCCNHWSFFLYPLPFVLQTIHNFTHKLLKQYIYCVYCLLVIKPFLTLNSDIDISYTVSKLQWFDLNIFIFQVWYIRILHILNQLLPSRMCLLDRESDNLQVILSSPGLCCIGIMDPFLLMISSSHQGLQNIILS